LLIVSYLLMDQSQGDKIPGGGLIADGDADYSARLLRRRFSDPCRTGLTPQDRS